MKTLKIVKMFQDVKTPIKADPTASGFDVFAYDFKKYYFEQDNGEEYQTGLNRSELWLEKNERVLIGTGLKATYGIGFEIQVRPRSGLALQQGLTVLNTPGTIDEAYRNEIGIILINLSNESRIIKLGDRVAQLVVCPVELPEIEIVSELTGNDRGGGFGHSGVN